MSPWLTIGLLVEAALLLGAVALTAVEQARLRRFSAAAQDPESAEKAAAGLPNPERGIAAEMAGAVRVRSTLDEALVKALVRAGDTVWGPPLGLLAAAHAAAVLVAFAPASLAMWQAAERVRAVYGQLAALPPARRYLEAPDALAAPFAALRAGLADAALLVVGLALAWAVLWWLRRPEAREARFVRTLLEVATRIRPGTPAPVGARLAEVLAPEPSLARPAAAAALLLGGVTVGWGILYATAEVRAENHAPARYAVWPGEDEQSDIRFVGGGALPIERGGQPFEDRGVPTVSIGPARVVVSNHEAAAIAGDGLGPGWPPRPGSPAAEAVAGARAVNLLVDADMDARGVVLPVLRWLHDRDVPQLVLVLERDLPGGRVKAELLASTVDEPPADALVFEVAPKGLSLGGVRVAHRGPGWRADAARAIRRHRERLLGAPPAPVAIRVAEGVRYGRLVEALGALDDSCGGGPECGLPGLGLRFSVVR